MRAKFLAALLVGNPVFSQNERDEARRNGLSYSIPEQIEVEAGYEIEDPQVWVHCCPGDLNSAPIAVAVDDECKEAVRVWMEEKRPLAIAQIKAQLEQINMIKNAEDKDRLLAMGEAYGLIGTAVKKPEKSVSNNPTTFS
jgi:hypothetical protein